MRCKWQMSFAAVMCHVSDFLTLRPDWIIKRLSTFRCAGDSLCFTTYFLVGKDQPKYPASALRPCSTTHWRYVWYPTPWYAEAVLSASIISGRSRTDVLIFGANFLLTGALFGAAML
jgi:hypothetical protein